ncbi:hypothetical protein VD0002_g4888 [Verticillium dahliae]|nr:hypothetical protein VD0002_g4888 [Verticillium dahliae]
MAYRPFREVTVGKCQVQTATARFGPDVIDVVRERDSDFHQSSDGTVQHDLTNGVPTGQFYTGGPPASVNGEPVSPERRVPRMPYYRNNLTALSQKYNLSFVPYENRLFVYRPRDVPRQTIPEDADLILATGPDRMSEYVGGTMDRRFSHQANAITTGFLGHQEIVLLVFDDGSVIAYYTKHIAEYVLLHVRPPGAAASAVKAAPIPRPFFRENVGSSAWGVAVHQESRLIAVSSNRREVTVFAFGLSKQPGGAKKGHKHDFPVALVAGRKRNWRIVLLLGEEGHNIPNVSFWDDKNGLAEKVCAVDIYGNTWILDIWKPCTAPYRIAHSDQGSANMIRVPQGGWGVMVVPLTGAMRATTSSDAFGTKKPTTVEYEIRTAPGFAHTSVIDISESLNHVRDSPIHGLQLPATLLHMNPPNQLIAAIFGQGVGLGLDDSTSEHEDDDDDDDDEEEEDDDDDEGSEAGLVGDAIGTNLYSEHNVDGGAPLEPPDTPLSLASDGSQEYDDMEDALDSNSSGLVWPWELTGSSTIDLAEFAPQISSPLAGAIPLHPQMLENVAAQSKIIFQGTMNGRRLPSQKLHTVQNFWLDMLYLPHTGKVYAFQSSFHHKATFLRRSLEVNRNTTPQDPATLRDITSRACLLRTYTTDIEMRRLSTPHRAVICRSVTSAQPHHPVFRHMARLNMLLRVPELSLVIVGSAVGQVVLLTPTTGDRGVNFADERKGHVPQGTDWSTRHGFRIDWVLPTQTDEDAGRRPARPLYGIAVGPVQEGGAEGMLLARPEGKTTAGPGSRRYRLMLHYRDHTILSYELSRNDDYRLEIV